MLTARLAAGAGLLLATTIFGRFLAIIAQVVTGAVLSDGDFGIYATAIGLQTIAGITRGGDAQNYLVTLPPAGRRRRVGTVFWVSMALYLVGVVPILAIAPSQAARFDSPILVPLLWVLCIALLTSPLRYVLRARVNARLDFRKNAIAATIGGVVNYGLMVVLALVLRNPMALAIPVLVGWSAEIAYLWFAARPNRHDFLPRKRFVLPVLHQLRGLIVVAAMTSLWTSGDYFLASLLVPTAVLGVYYFGYQLAVQPGRIFTATLMNVLIPVVRRVANDRARLRSALRRLLGVGGLAIGLMNMGLVASIASLERFLWDGRWSDAVFTVQILSLGLVFSGVVGMLTSSFLAERRYREAFICNMIRAVGMLLGVLIGTATGATADSIALSVTVMMTITSLATLVWVARLYGLQELDAVMHLLRCTAPAIIAGVGGAIAGDLALSGLPTGKWAALGATTISITAFGVAGMLGAFVVPKSVRDELINLVARRRRPTST